jgi:hypothetical protein
MEQQSIEPVQEKLNAKLRVIVREEFDRKSSRSFGVYNSEYEMRDLLLLLKQYLEERDATNNS